MNPKIIGIILSVVASIICGYIAWCCAMESPADAGENKNLSSLIIAICVALLSYHFWFAVLVIYVCAKLLMMIFEIFVDIIDFIYCVYILPMKKKRHKRTRRRSNSNSTLNKQKKSVNFYN